MNVFFRFRCRLCQRVEPTTRLLAHAGHAHRITEIATAASECISSCYQEQVCSTIDFVDLKSNLALLYNKGHNF